MDDDLESFTTSFAIANLLFQLCLFEEIYNLVTNRAGLQKSAVGDWRIVRSWRGEMPLLVGSIQAIAMTRQGASPVSTVLRHENNISRRQTGQGIYETEALP